jgi:2-methylcitrate dehydratase PrpD
MAAAAAVAFAAHLADGAAASALRVACASTGGPLETVAGRGDDFRVQPALAAAQGLLAAHAAEGGLAGTSGILEGPQGAFALIAGATWNGWPSRQLRPRLHDVTFKRYEGAMYAQAVFDALERLPPLTGDVARIELGVPAFAVGYSERSAANEDAPASLLGATLHALATLHPAARASTVHVTADEQLGRFGARIRIELADGSAFEATGDGDTSGWSSETIDSLSAERVGSKRLVRAVRALDAAPNVLAVERAAARCGPRPIR